MARRKQKSTWPIVILVMSPITLLIIVGIVLFAVYGGVADSPTNATSDENLELKTLAGTPRPLFEATSEADGTSLYMDVITFYEDNKFFFDQNSQRKEELLDLVLEAGQAKGVEQGWLDKKFELKPLAISDELSSLSAAFDQTMDKAYEKGKEAKRVEEYQQAEALARAGFAMAHHLYEKNGRLRLRRAGLSMMEKAAVAVQQVLIWRLNDENLSEDQATKDRLQKEIDDAKAWQTAVSDLLKAWEPKLKILFSVNANENIGDVLNMARNDKDPSFQMEAVLMLGYLKHNYNGKRANLNAINSAIEWAKAQEDPAIKAAGEAAAKMEREDVNR